MEAATYGTRSRFPLSTVNLHSMRIWDDRSHHRSDNGRVWVCWLASRLVDKLREVLEFAVDCCLRQGAVSHDSPLHIGSLLAIQANFKLGVDTKQEVMNLVVVIDDGRTT
jgi:hypothetical protein